MRNLAAEFGVDVDDRGSKVFDHFHHATLDGQADHSLIAGTDVVDASVLVGGPYKVWKSACYTLGGHKGYVPQFLPADLPAGASAVPRHRVNHPC